MSRQYTTCLIVVGLTLIAAFIDASGKIGKDYALTFGLFCCVLGLIWATIGIALTIAGKTRDVGHGFLMSAGITFLIGTGVCSTLLL